MSKSPSLRRIQADVRELLLNPSDRYHAAPLEDDMFEWHFTIRGADATDFEGGIYHGRILLPPEYPFKPPHIMFLTPSGRFDTNTKICLSFSAFHPELWQPAWGIRLILEALIAFLPSPADGAIGALDWTAPERQRLAKKSVNFTCPRCGKAADLLPKLEEGEQPKKEKTSRFEKEIEQLRLAQIANETKDTSTTEDGDGEDDVGKNENVSSAAITADAAQVTEEAPSFDIPNSVPALAHEPETAQAAPTILEEVIVDDEDATPAVIADENAANPYEIDISWITDPALNMSIVLLAVICYLLFRKASALLTELHTLNHSSSARY
ncbi:hypothetical protein MHU86_24517 [Fragilaria crotonensis]|nr:hypothetical protein MHU86_24517 [Fragilaria crotonensis]